MTEENKVAEKKGLPFREIYTRIRKKMESNPKERRRFFILLFGAVFFLDYLMFCYHADKNVFDIIPSLPLMEESRKVTLYLPSPDGKTIIKEKRQIGTFPAEEKFAAVLLSMVVRGSEKENTSMAVPVKLKLRRVWINREEGQCVYDFDPILVSDDTKIVAGSEKLFRESLKKTVRANLPSIKEMYLLERGVPGRKLWEM